MIPFNKPYLTGNESKYIQEAIQSRKLCGDGPFSKKCARWLESNNECAKVILVPSGTAALEMMMLLADIGPGDEVIMPSFTFSSTANAVVLRGATPVFVDIRSDTLNIDENLIEAAITSKTKAICPVHYAGVACAMETINLIAQKYSLVVLADAAQAIMSSYKGKPLPSWGDMSALSFHETKNIQCGEGGALIINNMKFIERAEIIMEKGTDRSKFFRGEIDKYTWVDLGSSMLINELTAAFLWAQLEHAEEITNRRLFLWSAYNEYFSKLESDGILRCPIVPQDCQHNAHIYYVLFKNETLRNEAMSALKQNGYTSVFHYVPLDSAKAGFKFGKTFGSCYNSQQISQRLLRMPLFFELPDDSIYMISEVIKECKSIL